MLTDAQVLAGPARRRQRPSLETQYHAYLAQRIDAHKDTLRRDELLALGEEAARELQGDEQFLLTEVLLADCVDRLIRKRLRLPTFRKWRDQIHRLRDAQRQPTHWGLDPASPAAAILPRLEPRDRILVVGPGVESAAYLYAAWDCAVTYVDDDIGSVERVESRIAGEALGEDFTALVLGAGVWLDAYLAHPWHLVVLDLGALAAADAAQRFVFLEQAARCTVSHGVHVLVPGGGLVPDAVRSCYPGWIDASARGMRAGGAAGVMLARPALSLALETEQSGVA